MSRVRPSAVAGTFYPADPSTLRARVRQLLASARTGVVPAEAPRALIVPHAGYAYSGPVAASAYVCLTPFREAIRRVVLVGPSHHASFRGLVGSAARAFATPLGEVEVAPLGDRAEALGVSLDDRAQAPEHSLEVQLPFLLEVLGSFSIVPLLTGRVGADDVCRTLLELWAPDTLVVVSSDLSHYLPAAAAHTRDAATAAAIEQLEPSLVGPRDACGHTAVQGLLLAARARHLRARTADLRDSGEVSGRRGGVVGYGAFVFIPAGSVGAGPATMQEVRV